MREYVRGCVSVVFVGACVCLRHICVRVCIYVCVCIRVCVCMYVCVLMYTCACVCQSVCLYLCVSACMYACLCMCMCARVPPLPHHPEGLLSIVKIYKNIKYIKSIYPENHVWLLS